MGGGHSYLYIDLNRHDGVENIPGWYKVERSKTQYQDIYQKVTYSITYHQGGYSWSNRSYFYLYIRNVSGGDIIFTYYVDKDYHVVRSVETYYSKDDPKTPLIIGFVRNDRRQYYTYSFLKSEGSSYGFPKRNYFLSHQVQQKLNQEYDSILKKTGKSRIQKPSLTSDSRSESEPGGKGLPVGQDTKSFSDPVRGQSTDGSNQLDLSQEGQDSDGAVQAKQPAGIPSPNHVTQAGSKSSPPPSQQPAPSPGPGGNDGAGRTEGGAADGISQESGGVTSSGVGSPPGGANGKSGAPGLSPAAASSPSSTTNHEGQAHHERLQSSAQKSNGTGSSNSSVSTVLGAVISILGIGFVVSLIIYKYPYIIVTYIKALL